VAKTACWKVRYPMLHVILKAAFFICLLGFLGCCLAGFLMAASRFPQSIRNGLRFNDRLRARTPTQEDFALKPSDKQFLARYLRVWLCAVVFLVGTAIFSRFTFSVG
jgi:hypothetical protein